MKEVYMITKQDAEEFLKCEKDVVYFSEKYMGIKLYEYQKELIIEAELAADTARQIGFTMMSIIKIVHSIIFKPNQKILYVVGSGNGASSHIKHLILQWFDTCTYRHKPQMSTITTNYLSFDNGNTLTISNPEKQFRRETYSQVYVTEVNNISSRIFDNFIKTLSYRYLVTNYSVFWVWGCSANNANRNTNIPSLKKYVLPFWVRNDELYIKYKITSELIGEQNTKMEFLI